MPQVKNRFNVYITANRFLFKYWALKFPIVFLTPHWFIRLFFKNQFLQQLMFAVREFITKNWTTLDLICFWTRMQILIDARFKDI